jgi:hypothetical protein
MKYLGLSDVERAFVHVDYEDSHDVGTEHKALYDIQESKEPFAQRIQQRFKPKADTREAIGPKKWLEKRMLGRK